MTSNMASHKKQANAAENDANIMATNDSSIVSKRAAELLYLPEPHFIRHFVKKKKPRSPLISRGYWLRMKAIEIVVREFIAERGTACKMIVNLGAGYDAFPFDFLAKEYHLCEHTTFVDVDYPELIQRKCQTIRNTPAMMNLLQSSISPANGDSVVLRSKHYVAAGCDLNFPAQLEQLIANEAKGGNCSVLFVAEVSISYMETSKANDVINSAASIPNCK